MIRSHVNSVFNLERLLGIEDGSFICIMQPFSRESVKNLKSEVTYVL